MAHLLVPPKSRFFDVNGNPLVGGKLFSYEAGTTTPLATYTDKTEGTTNANPVILDANGEANVWLGANPYKIVLKNSADVTQWTVDNITFLNDDALTLAKIPNGMFTADTTGRAKFADQFITLAKIGNSIFTADSTGRGKFVSGFVNTDLLATDSVTTAKILNANVTPAKLSALNYFESLPNNGTTLNASTLTALSNLSGTITASGGRSMRLKLMQASSSSPAVGQIEASASGTVFEIAITKDGGSNFPFKLQVSGGTQYSPCVFEWTDYPSSGSVTYAAYYRIIGGSGTITISNVTLQVMEF